MTHPNDSNESVLSAAPASGAGPSPSLRLVSAALVGLLGASVMACGDEESSCEESDAGSGSEPQAWEDAGEEEIGEKDAAGEDAASSTPDAGADAGAQADAAHNAGSADAAGSDAASADGGTRDAAVGPQTLREVEGNRTLVSLTQECDTLGGYMQVHAACSGSNDCAGFSYGDWDPGVYTEHTCAAANGCNGASCVVLPKDSGKTPDDILFAKELPAGGPQPCWFCHSESVKQPDGSYLPDKTKFKIWVPEGSTRNAQNWLDLSAAEQMQITAFGRVSSITSGGKLYTQRSMKGYHKLYSRAEIERVVAHLRTLTPIVKVVEAPK